MKRVLAVAVLLVAAVAIMVPGASLYFEVGGGKRCNEQCGCGDEYGSMCFLHRRSLRLSGLLLKTGSGLKTQASSNRFSVSRES